MAKITTQEATHVGQDAETGEPSLHCWRECKLVQALQKTVWSFLKKLKIILSHTPAIALLDIYPKDTKILIQRIT